MSQTVVVDTSIVVKWALNETDTPTALALLESWTKDEMVILAPAILAYEVTNAIYQRVRRSEMELHQAQQWIAKIFQTEIVFLFSQDPALSLQAMSLAHTFNLPATYDAHYLALAESKNCDLWTADARLWNAVKGKIAWVKWLGEYQH